MTPPKLLLDKSNTSSFEELENIDNVRPEKKNVLDHKQLKVNKVTSNKI